MITLARLMLIAALLYMVYQETGFWTTLAIFLCFFGFEMLNLLHYAAMHTVKERLLEREIDA